MRHAKIEYGDFVKSKENNKHGFVVRIDRLNFREGPELGYLVLNSEDYYAYMYSDEIKKIPAPEGLIFVNENSFIDLNKFAAIINGIEIDITDIVVVKDIIDAASNAGAKRIYRRRKRKQRRSVADHK